MGCASNQLTSLDVSQNTALTHLFCDRNQLTSLEVIQNTVLIFISCWANELTRLDFSLNTALFYLNCDSNQLTCLNVKNGNNTNFILFTAVSNSTLTCIEVDDKTWSASNWTDIDAASSFSINCPNNCDVSIEESLSMKSIIFYPNPANNFVTFDFSKYPVQLSLFDSQGKLVFDKTIKDKLYKLSTRTYKSGVYFYNVSVNGNMNSGKLIIR